jgi:hypothetical protein
VSFGLAGPGAERYHLSGQIVFHGAPPLLLEPGKKLCGPGGREPLVALRVIIAEKIGEAAVTRYPSPWHDPGVTQIFRAQES